MRCFLEKTADKNDLLREELNRFWETEIIGKSEESVITSLRMKCFRTRYVTRLPYKTDHDLLPGNFQVAKIRLQNLKRYLLKKKYLRKIKIKVSKIMKKAVLLNDLHLMRYFRNLKKYIICSTNQF